MPIFELNQILVKLLNFLVIAFSLISFHSYSQEKKDSLFYNNSFKLDLLPLYYDFFDNRVQIRAGIEYEKFLKDNISLCGYFDFGVYDKYKFIKYYNFFNENQGLYSITQNVTIKGLHLLPSVNYFFHSPKKKTNRNFFGSVILDLGYYQKKLTYMNSNTLESYSYKYNQSKFGAGLGLGVKSDFGSRFFLELKTSFFAKIFYSNSDKTKNQMKSLDAQWTSQNYKFWWITNLKIGYAF